nr:hypothetical protein [Tanacetum cinerariifolium]
MKFDFLFNLSFLIKRLRILLWEGESLGWKLRVFPLNSGQVIPSIALLQNGFIGCVQKKPGWTPKFTEEEEEDYVSVEYNHGGIHSDQEINNCNDVSDVEEVLETCFNVPKGSKINEEESSLKYPLGFTQVGNLNEGHLDGGCAKKVNEEVVGDDNSFVHTVGGIKFMIVVVYAPQEASEKRMLYDYLTHVSDQWDGETVMMGDFNEVRYKSERFGSNFKAHDADIFNSFIHNAGLNEVHLGGNRYISDHCPILLREAMFDYGPIPFRFYNYWLEVDGFDKLVRDAWNDAP